MPFDPTLPQPGTEIDANQMRGQLNGLNDLITAIVQIVAAMVDSVTTVNPGDPAAASVSLIGNELHFTFQIPKGSDGAQGIPGADGGPGPQGPPFAQCIVDSVTTLPPGVPAFVSVSFDGVNVHLAFGIPMGFQGEIGPTGPPGEVTSAQLSTAITTAINGTSNNTNAVATLGLVVSDPPTQAEMQALANKVDELILAARR